MIYHISLLTAFLVGILYPLSFWISFDDPLKQGFPKFHMGLPCFLAGVVLIVMLANGDFPISLKVFTGCWTLALFIATFYYWQKETPHAAVLSAVSLLGAAAYTVLWTYLFGFRPSAVAVSFLGGAIFCASLFAMNLGHWYLNVHGLPVKHLIRSTYVLGFFLALRLFWDAFTLMTGKIVYQDEMIPLLRFSATMDGVLLYLGILFGVVFPLVSLYFALGTLKLKNTQATTGILYVILCAVLIGDMTFKYYQFKFGVSL